jgi:hypothetical protein
MNASRTESVGASPEIRFPGERVNPIRKIAGGIVSILAGIPSE